MTLTHALDSSLAFLPLTALFTFGITLASVATGFSIEGALSARRRIFAVNLAEGQVRWESWANLRFCVLASVTFAAVLGTGALGPMEESWTAGIFSFLFLWIGFDFYYYWLHRALHWRPLIPFHRLHHKSRVCTPLTGFSLGWVESASWIAGWVVFALLASWIHPLNMTGLMAYGVVIFVANVIGHTNTEWFPRLSGTRTMSWGNHPITFHALHHARYVKHFSFAFTAFDRLFGTEWEDWQSLFRRILDGQPLTRLQERGEPSK
jgi:lathosterol oxidase